MATIKIKNLGGAIQSEVVERLRSAGLEQVLVSNAKRRIEDGGDSEFKYPDLWAHPKSFRFTTGGQPLKDTGQHVLNTLFGVTQHRDDTTIRLTLMGSKIASMHQTGFKTKGPNFIPLSRKAQITHVNGANPEDEGLVLGEDYIIAWKGVTVPQRKIFNMPPEDIDDLTIAIEAVLN